MYIYALKQKDTVKVWERIDRNKRVVKSYDAPYYFFIKSENGEHTDIYGNKLEKIECDSYNDFKQNVEYYKSIGEDIYESDIKPEYKILSDIYYGEPSDVGLNFSFYDIEVDVDPSVGFSLIDDRIAPINAISLHNYWENKDYVILVPPDNLSKKEIEAELKKVEKEYPNVNIIVKNNEKDLLKEFINLIENSDVVSGWNSAYFDDMYVYERAKILLGDTFANKLCFEGANPPRYKEVFDRKMNEKRKRLEIYGRNFIDYLEIFKKFEVSERRSYSLESVAEDMLPDMKKLSYDGTLYALYRNDFAHFVRYNIRDCEILRALEDKLGYMQLAIEFAHSSCALLKDVTGTIKLAECDIINYCHHVAKVRVEDKKIQELSLDDNSKFTGALVLPPQVGMHEWVASVDVASLYPSTMRTLNISPETLIGQFFDNHLAFEEISDRTDKVLYFRFNDGEIVDKPAHEWANFIKDHGYVLSSYGTIFDQNRNGVIPSILTDWFSRRKLHKKLASDFKAKKDALEDKNSDEAKKYQFEYEKNNRLQYILKIRLNSMYGAFGNKMFRFFDIRIAESTTRSGQSALMHMVKKVAELIDGEYKYPSESAIYSDTDSCYFKTHAKNLDEAIKIGKFVQKKVNESFPQFCIDAFFCKKEFSDKIACELDVISPRSIFITKKQYVMLLYYSDGAKCDKLKLMGIQLKKTTMPKEVSEHLTKILRMILTEPDWRVGAEEIIRYRDFIIEEADLSLIGLPKGVKNVEKYTDEYNMNKKARLPGHVAASIFYNICLDAYGDKENNKINSGTKIKVYYLKKSFGRFNSIALPTDLKTLPKWFIENFSELIDRDRHADVLINKTLRVILNPLKKLVPTRKQMLYEDIVEY